MEATKLGNTRVGPQGSNQQPPFQKEFNSTPVVQTNPMFENPQNFPSWLGIYERLTACIMQDVNIALVQVFLWW